MKEGPSNGGKSVLSVDHRKLLWSKATVVGGRGKSQTRSPAGMIERGERKRTAVEVSKSD